MLRLVLICTAGLLTLLSQTHASAPLTPDLFVSPSGNDRWSGRLSAPNRERTDGPFATLARARDAVRQLRAAAPRRERPIVVAIRGGIYRVSEPVDFQPEDSGTRVSPTIYTAWQAERPVISGGVPLTGWRIQPDGRWVTRLADNPQAPQQFAQLWANGTRRYRPRWPKNGYSLMDKGLRTTEGLSGYDRFAFPEGALYADWANREDVELLIFQLWTMTRSRLADVDEKRRQVRLSVPLRDAWFLAFKPGQRFLAENVKEALSAPGEWYLDRPTGTVTYLPVRGERPVNTVITVPKADALIKLVGDAMEKRFVQHLQFRGITFEHTQWVCPPDGQFVWQSEVTLPAAVQLHACRQVTLEDCRIRHTGGYGIEVSEGSRDCIVQNCELTDLGAGGVKLGEFGAVEPERQSSRNAVINCLIAHGGRLHPAGAGVAVGASGFNRVSNNTIYDLYYTGITCGWNWGYAPNPTERNIIERNHIAQIGQGVLSDMGGIYTLGSNRGSMERYNLIHDVQSYDYGGWGIYFDEGTSEMLAENNVVFHCRTAGFHQHYGRENVVRNNLFALNEDAQMQRSRIEAHRSFTFERNVVVWRSGDPLASLWSDNRLLLRNNMYWRTDGQPIVMAGKSWAEWQAAGHDAGSVIADPGPIRPVSLRSGFRSEAAQRLIGFQPIDLSWTGRMRGAKRLPLPRLAPPAYPIGLRHTPLQMTRYEDEFESDEPGPYLGSLTASVDPRGGAAVIATDGPHSGSHYLKLIDAPGQQHAHDPHVSFNPNWKGGTVSGSFMVRLSPGAVFWHEWRSAPAGYHTGPSFVVDAEGQVTVKGKPLTRVPYDQWIGIEIVCSLKDGQRGRWSLCISVPGQPVFVRHDLTCAPGFGAVQWIGFVSGAQTDATIGLDTLLFERKP